MSGPKVRVTRHATEKFELLRGYGFVVTEEQVQATIASPDRVDQRDDVALSIKVLDREFGLRVVYRSTNDNIVS